MDAKSNMTSKYVTIFLVLNAITNEKTLELTQIDRLLAASKVFPAETHSNNSCRYTCCYIYLGVDTRAPKRF